MSATLFTMAFGDKRLPETFWSKIEVVHRTECWLWTGATKDSEPGNYGLFTFHAPWEHEPRIWRVHRLMAAMIFGPEAIDGLEICHDCKGGDNKQCCQPSHLFIGTAKDNAIDSIVKGQRSRVGLKRGPVSRLEGRLEEIVATCREHSFSHACRLLGVSDTQLRRWLRERGICPACLQGIRCEEELPQEARA